MRPLFAEAIIVIDSTEKIDSCIGLSKELKVSAGTLPQEVSIKILDYKNLRQSFEEAQDKFFRLEIADSARITENLLSEMSDSIVYGGNPDEIFSLFNQALSLKILILLSKKEEEKAKELLREYIPVFSFVTPDSKKIHPSLKNFLLIYLEKIRNSAVKDKETADILRNSFSLSGKILFNGNPAVPDFLYRGKNILIIKNDGNGSRVVVSDFSEVPKNPLFIGNFGRNNVFIVFSEEGFAKMKNLNSGREMVFCRNTGSGIISGEGKVISREEALSGNIKVEIIRKEEKDSKENSKKDWWLYAAGGTVAAAIITSIILLNAGERGSEVFKDKIQVK
ncbi:MAG: hypothetical protein N3B13_00575 [Deltaproteobacteria bacterium]|nr:hypothetical protein [Deltaproteobacteria bacterium]